MPDKQPTPIAKAIKPPANRTEIIAAMAIRMVEQACKEYHAACIKHEEDSKALRDRAFKWFIDHGLKVLSPVVNIQVNYEYKERNNGFSRKIFKFGGATANFTTTPVFNLPAELQAAAVANNVEWERIRNDLHWASRGLTDVDAIKRARGIIRGQLEISVDKRVSRLLSNKDASAGIDAMLAVLRSGKQLQLK